MLLEFWFTMNIQLFLFVACLLPQSLKMLPQSGFCFLFFCHLDMLPFPSWAATLCLQNMTLCILIFFFFLQPKVLFLFCDITVLKTRNLRVFFSSQKIECLMFQMEHQHSAVKHCSVSLLNGLCYVVYCSVLNNLKKAMLYVFLCCV